VRRLGKAIADNRRRCAQSVAATDTTLTEIYGISEVLAAKIIGQIGDIARFPSSDHLASYAGTAPIEASSGDVIRHRLSRRGNRQLNNAIHLAAHVQAIRPGPGRDYLQRRLAAGNSRAEAMRALKRQITKAIYRALSADAHHGLATAA
jgi:transposase